MLLCHYSDMETETVPSLQMMLGSNYDPLHSLLY